MRVLVTARPERPCWTFVTELAHGLEREGVQVILPIMGGPLNEHQRAQLGALRNVEFYESTFTADWTNADLREIQRTGEWLLRVASDCDVDIVHLHELWFAALPWRTPVVISVLQPVANPAPVRGSWSPAMPHALVAPTRRLLDEVQHQFGAIGSGYVVPLGRTTENLQERGKEPMVVALAEGTLALEHAAAASRIAARISWPVFVIGAAPNAPAGTSRANTHFLGPLLDADRGAVLSRASAFVQPSVDVESGYGVWEAASYACALVLPDTAELREQWDGAAAFVALNDEEALRSTLIWLIDDANARRDYGGRAQHRAQSLTAERMAGAYLSIYIELMLNASVSPGLFA